MYSKVQFGLPIQAQPFNPVIKTIVRKIEKIFLFFNIGELKFINNKPFGAKLASTCWATA